MGMEHDWNAFLRSLEGTRNDVLKVLRVAQVGTWHEVQVHVHVKTALVHDMPKDPVFSVSYDEELRQVAVILGLHIGIPADRFADVEKALEKNRAPEQYAQCEVVISERGLVMSVCVRFDLPELVEEDLQAFARKELLRTFDAAYWKWFTMSNSLHVSLGLRWESPPALRH
jgi:hypothetical protein